MRISLIISSLGSGGAERVLTGMANYFNRKGYEITVITYTSKKKDFYKLDKTINRKKLDLEKNSRNILESSYNFARRITILRSAIIETNPDIVISFIDVCNILTLIALQGTKIPVIVSERTNPLVPRIRKFWRVLRRIVYTRANYIVIQTEGLRGWAEKHIDSSKVVVIPNSLDQSRLQNLDAAFNTTYEPSSVKKVISMGRFTHEKGHDLLIESLKPILDSNNDWILEIIGDGPLKPKLNKLVSDLGLTDRVVFHGKVENPFKLIMDADIFVLPSRVEGFPNALLEAMALGKPCISFNCPSGPKDLIDEDNGILVENGNVRELTTAIELCINSKLLRDKLGNNALKVRTKYNEKKIMSKWEKLLNIDK